MTLYIHRISFLVPVKYAAACNRAANALGRRGDNFTARLSATGQEPATHLGGAAVETENFLAGVASSPDLPVGVPWPETLEPGDWKAVADHLTVVSGPARGTDAYAQFSAMLEEYGLKHIEG